ncbi:GNAT family N-acetyltransferase [Dactylosporangium sp. CA-092794]|uniref:GNAT family N-acetyltransferase n=1 Tax=Dactylosporangium sp. CA-092794 TaxID=3239929 RepID=UPI003D94F7B4
MSDYVLRTATADDLDAVSRVRREAFGATGAPETAYRSVIEPERIHLAERAGEIAGVAGIFTRDMAVPGGVIPVAHVTGVAVANAHTRRGLLRRLITDQLTTAPEALAALWASEGRIYQRFGYGLASQNVTLRANLREVSLRMPPSPGELRGVVPANAIAEFSQVYSRVLPTRPGWTGRSETWWKHLTLDAETRREGHTAERAVLFENPDGVVDGYARGIASRPAGTTTGPSRRSTSSRWSPRRPRPTPSCTASCCASTWPAPWSRA